MISERLSPRITLNLFCALLLVAGCAAPASQQDRRVPLPHGGAQVPVRSEIATWRLDELAELHSPMVVLRSSQGVHGTVATGQLQRIRATGEKIMRAAGDGAVPELVVIGSGTVNAFAYFNGTQPTIAFSLGMLQLLAEDEDAWAALFGHELAHLRLNHLGGMKQRRERAAVTSSLAGAILSAIGIPLASVAADATAALADRAYSRDDEREADRTGLEYMRRAGFAATGAITLQQRLLTVHGGSSITFLSTHPGGEERIENIRRLIHGD